MIALNANIPNPDFLSNLKVVDVVLGFRGSQLLTNLDGLSSLEFTENLYVDNNPNLSECCILKYFIKNNVVLDYSLGGNGSICSGFGGIMQNCIEDDNDGVINDNCPLDDNFDQADVE